MSLLRVTVRLVLLVVAAVAVLVLGLPLYLAGIGSVPVPPEADVPKMPGGDLPIRVYLDREQRLVAMPLEDYVKGVVAAEMPASFHSEALKAQAVVARTYAVRRMRVFGGAGCDRHSLADICTDPGSGQAYADREELKERWGVVQYLFYWRRIEQAVDATRGLILTYDGAPIDAVYHSTSGGQTAAAQEVWGKSVPYLRSVPSPHEERSPRARQVLRLTLRELAQRLDMDPEQLQAARERGSAVLSATRTDTGRVREVVIAGKKMDANEFRQRLQLNSTWFTWELDGDTLVIHVRGYGHGVGMSQYGADGMARAGSSFHDILRHYYPGTQLRPIFLD